MKTLTVTEDRVKDAAATCPDAKRVLEKLFPDVFVSEGPRYVDPANLNIEPRRSGGNFKNKGWFLPDNPSGCYSGKIQWDVTLDNLGAQVLIGVLPTK